MTGQEKVDILLVDDQPAKLLSYEAILEELGEWYFLPLPRVSIPRYPRQILFYDLSHPLYCFEP